MQVLLSRSAATLAAWRDRPFWPAAGQGPRPSDNVDVYTREVGREEPGEPLPDGPHRRLAFDLLRYRVFPRALVTGILDREPLEVGDTIGTRYHLMPGIDLLFASRVVDRFDGRVEGEWRTGFTYRTLVGHPELGEETFSAIKELATGAVRVELRAWSRPGTRLARAFSPLVRRFQVRASRQAVAALAAPEPARTPVR